MVTWFFVLVKQLKMWHGYIMTVFIIMMALIYILIEYDRELKSNKILRAELEDIRSKLMRMEK